MDIEELFEQELENYIFNGDIPDVSEEARELLLSEYEVYDQYFDCGDLCWDSNMEEILVKSGLLRD